MTLTELWGMVRHSVSAWIDDYAPSMGAALAYYTMFAIAPLLVIVIAVAGIMFGDDAAKGHVLAELRGIMGEEGALAVEELLQSASDPEKSTLAALVGIITLLVGATTPPRSSWWARSSRGYTRTATVHGRGKVVQLPDHVPARMT